MPRGRPPTHPTIRRLQGNPGKRVIPPWVPAEGVPFVPDHLSEDAQHCVRTIIATMPRGTYGTADSFALAAFATAWAIHKRAAEALRTEPPIARGRRGTMVPSPWLRILNQQARAMAQWGSQLYLDPRTRAGLIG